MSTAAGDASVPGRRHRSRLLAAAIGLVVGILALYVLLPRVAGLDETWGRLRDGDAAWIVLAGVLEIGSCAGYVVLLRGVLGAGERLTWPVSWRLTLAGVAASRLLATAGAGGIALTAWALNRMGMSARAVAQQLATFFVVLYGIFMAARVVTGMGLGAGWLPGPSPFGVTVVPALFGAAVIGDAIRRCSARSRGGRVTCSCCGPRCTRSAPRRGSRCW